ncbi:Pyoverdine biosynthesis [Metarhizium album ARSEF 1941]|uniref:Pyoverdine biosynthesis n=1 Tax=Metarhizium album (strain ARSEF 1941) TaxID=1081103 RepID=A0A0B2WLT9_METAS|nr:Pyoverdine biosynthesis [Metarhizium album ARSEF 1941]KHN94903.1 Pyoverdine biosynthesis [Metarhizium album ARSEF 1941]
MPATIAAPDAVESTRFPLNWTPKLDISGQQPEDFLFQRLPDASNEKFHNVEITPPDTPARSTTPVHDVDQLASAILDVLQRYGQHQSSSGVAANSGQWLGKSLFMDKVRAQIEKSQAVRLIMPAFPWKSVNKLDKVTGILPDLGEELALYRLNQMCEDIKQVYPLGGKVFIATDGLVFDDVVGIPDEDTWAYGEGLVEMAKNHGLKNIHLMRVMDILGYTDGKNLDKELYLSLAQRCRDELLASYGRTEAEVRQMMKDDPDTLLTYCGFIRFLEADLKFSPITAATKAISGQQYRKTVKKVAIQMMIRAESFTKLLQAYCPEYVRLSIHPSSGAVKLSVPLITQASGDFPRSPWHSSLAISLDGSYKTVHSRDVQESHDLVPKDGRGFYFREKSEQWDFEDDEIVCEPRYPNRMIVRPARLELLGTKSLSARQLEKLAVLRAAHTAGPVVATGFAPIHKHGLGDKF